MKIFTKQELKKLIVDEVSLFLQIKPLAYIVYEYYEINFVFDQNILDDMMMFHRFYDRWLMPLESELTLFLNLKTNWMRSKMLKENLSMLNDQILDTCVMNDQSLYVEKKDEDELECKYIVKKDNLRFKDLNPYFKDENSRSIGYYAWEMELESYVYYGNRLYVKTLTKKRTKKPDAGKKLRCSKCKELQFNHSFIGNIKEIDQSFFISCSECHCETKIE